MLAKDRLALYSVSMYLYTDASKTDSNEVGIGIHIRDNNKNPPSNFACKHFSLSCRKRRHRDRH